MPLNLQRGDIVRLRREHPCGNADFEVVRLGADIGLTCTTCGRRIMLARSLLERRLERFVTRVPRPETPDDLDLTGLDSLDLGGAGGARGTAASEPVAPAPPAPEPAQSDVAGSAVPRPPATQ